jgi:hypothetical protein
VVAAGALGSAQGDLAAVVTLTGGLVEAGVLAATATGLGALALVGAVVVADTGSASGTMATPVALHSVHPATMVAVAAWQDAGVFGGVGSVVMSPTLVAAMGLLAADAGMRRTPRPFVGAAFGVSRETLATAAGRVGEQGLVTERAGVVATVKERS